MIHHNIVWGMTNSGLNIWGVQNSQLQTGDTQANVNIRVYNDTADLGTVPRRFLRLRVIAE